LKSNLEDAFFGTKIEDVWQFFFGFFPYYTPSLGKKNWNPPLLQTLSYVLFGEGFECSSLKILNL